MLAARRRWARVSPALLLVLALAACGGGTSRPATNAKAAGPAGAKSATASTGTGTSTSTGGGAAPSPGGAGAKGAAQVDVAVVVPLTGPNAEEGQMYRLGAQLAADDINHAGGVAGLGGAQIHLVVQDGGAQVSQTVGAVQSVLTTHHIVAGIGTGISSTSLAASEVAQQHHVPWVDLAFDDKLTQRGFNYLFITSPLQSALDATEYPAVQTLAKQAGISLTRVGYIDSPNPNSQLSAQHIVKVYAPRFGWHVVIAKTVQKGSITGAVLSTIVSQIKAAKPQVMFIGSAPSDIINIQRQEVAEGMTPVPWVLIGAPYLSKSFINALGAGGTQGIMAVGSAGVYPSDQALARRIAAAGQVPQEYNLVGYAEIRLIADALQKAGSADPAKLRAALANIDVKGGPAGSVWPCDCMRFAKDGRTSTGKAVLVQWQGGKAVTVYPPSVATTKAYWPAQGK